MNPSLCKFMLARTPKHILHPTPTMNTALPLNTGASIPALGLGTWQSAPGEVKAAVIHAIEAGYRHIDCAFCYQNEDEVGAALQDVISRGIVKREDLFITSKLWCTFHTRAEEGLQKSLDMLKTPYVDLYLMHWPVPMSPNGNHPLFPKLPDGSRDIDHIITHIQTWKNLEKLIKENPSKVKAIGVANYSVKYLEKLLAQALIVPAANQIENHPLLPQQEVVDFCKAKGIHITAYSPLGSTGSPLFKDEVVNEVAKKHSVGPGTVLLSYHLARGSSVLAKSVTPSRIDENRKLISLNDSEMEKLESIHKKQGLTRFVYPPFGVNVGFPDKTEGVDLSG
ncbi:NADP-dependent oxidoreductase domain-containing protein [Massariosphaeria phaeospora]|uniref:NADP-dependent oxidoreductase domain-containing protein n=1 Tax=Massariosphaeria phaeospora TaxID=100035 RepID=A0A7C8I0X4_9PLEO|nr:NADP-dependent oxidoreductase domain-containing protein [Massariosphaeria phaeospora]